MKALGADDAICSNPTQLGIETLKRRLHLTPILKKLLKGGGSV